MLYLRRMRRHSVGGPRRRIRAFLGFAASRAISAERGSSQRHWDSGRRIGVTRSVGCSGLNFDEIFSTAVPSAKHSRLLASYLLNLERGAATVRDMIVVDVCDLLELGAMQQAADLCAVLGCFLSDYPEAGLATSPCEAMRIGFAGQGATGIAEESRSIAVRARRAAAHPVSTANVADEDRTASFDQWREQQCSIFIHASFS